MKICQNCMYWINSYEGSDGLYGICDHPVVEARVLLDGDDENDQVIHTHEQFGCIYFTPQNGYVVSKLPDV